MLPLGGGRFAPGVHFFSGSLIIHPTRDFYAILGRDPRAFLTGIFSDVDFEFEKFSKIQS